MAKSYFTPAKMFEHFEPLVGDVLDYTQEELAEELSEMFWVEFPSADGFPTAFPSQPDYTDITRQIKLYRAERQMTHAEAMGIVVDLAQQNVLTETNGESELEEEMFKQQASINVVTAGFAAPSDWTYESLQPLGEEWLALQMEADLTEEWQTNAACDKRMTEIETALPADYVAGMALALEWVLKSQLQEAIDDHDHHDLA